MNEFLMEWVMLDSSLDINVMDWKSLDFTMTVHHFALTHAVRREMIGLVASYGVMCVTVSRLNLTFHDLHLFRLNDVHAEHIFEMLGSFTGLKRIIAGIIVMRASIVGALMMIAFLKREAMTLWHMIIVVDIVGVLRLVADLVG